MDFTVTQWGGTTEQLLTYLDGLAAAPQSKERTCFTNWDEWRNYIIYNMNNHEQRRYRIPPKLFIARRGNDFGGLIIMTNTVYNPPDTFYIEFVCSTIKGAAEALIGHLKSMPEVNVLMLSAVWGTQKFYVSQGFRFMTNVDDPGIKRGKVQVEELIWKKDGYMADTEGGRKRRKTRRSKKRSTRGR